MAQYALQDGAHIPTFATSYIATSTPAAEPWRTDTDLADDWLRNGEEYHTAELGSTGKGILIGILSAFGSAALVALVVAIVYFFRYTPRGRIFLDRMSRPGEFDDEQQFMREEEEALAEMDELQRAEYFRAKLFTQVNPPESMPTDISLSQFLAIQEKGVSAWEFIPELEIANAFVEARTEIEFFEQEACSVQSNLPIPKQNETYYWEAKMYDLPATTVVHVGVTTKPYPLFRLPGLHRTSIAYISTGHRRYNQPFSATVYGPAFVQGDVVGVGYRPRTGTLFFTRNGKKLEDIAHGLKSQNFFPTVGANGPCNVHVNFGQSGFLFIEANVKKWGLAPQTGSLAPPPPYGSEAGSILLEGGQQGVREGQGYIGGHGRTNSAQVRLAQGRPTRSPGPERSPTDISLAQFDPMEEEHRLREQDEEDEDDDDDDGGEGGVGVEDEEQPLAFINPGLPFEPQEHPPPDYESPEDMYDDDDDDDTPRASSEQQSLLPRRGEGESPPIPTYEAAVSDAEGGIRGRSERRDG
ncbi:Protein ssh4 [Elasticomyces elasticus]|nr:Protein ssh4 [Elasticomyces elasticus]KAK3630209.1 Protein ssh4 [Elasticomyces elasticus]KAK4920164.1 Protein ssh4 [Elasticomyces elasticus]KAK5748940.1 Protein ssh4 [Elasticomyces elasticus]